MPSRSCQEQHLHRDNGAKIQLDCTIKSGIRSVTNCRSSFVLNKYYRKVEYIYHKKNIINNLLFIFVSCMTCMPVPKCIIKLFIILPLCLEANIFDFEIILYFEMNKVKSELHIHIYLYKIEYSFKRCIT